MKFKNEKECLAAVEKELLRQDIKVVLRNWNSSMIISCFKCKIDYHEGMSLEISNNGIAKGIYRN